jgi:hypothetical protein
MPRATERVARNEAVFREVNDRIHEVSAHWAVADAVTFVCECSHVDCVETLTLTPAEYEAVRSEPGRLVVAPHHGDPLTQRQVRSEGGRYEVVKKISQDATS